MTRLCLGQGLPRAALALLASLVLFTGGAGAQGLPALAAQQSIFNPQPDQSSTSRNSFSSNDQSGTGQSQNLGTPSINGSSGNETNANRQQMQQGATSSQNEQRRRPPAPPSEFQKLVQSSTGRLLPMFGTRFFQDAENGLSSLDNIPVTADYIVGPGDELVIRAWGSIDVDYRARVDRNGQVNLPRVGSFTVAGVKASELESHLRSQISRIFTNFNLSVTLGQLRGVKVFVVGPAERPGVYTLSSQSTLLSAVVAAGGPLPSGSMRKIGLRRDGRLISELDVYDFLVQGDKSRDVQLAPGDVVVFNPAGPRVAITGAIDTPAIYELRSPQEPLREVLRYAGGQPLLANPNQVQIERVDNTQVPAARYVDQFKLDGNGLQKPLRDGDVVTMLPISPQFANAVTLRGHVAQPLRYAYTPGMRIRDLIPDKEALISPDFYRRRNLLVQVLPDTDRQNASGGMADQRRDDYGTSNRQGASSGMANDDRQGTNTGRGASGNAYGSGTGSSGSNNSGNYNGNSGASNYGTDSGSSAAADAYREGRTPLPDTAALGVGGIRVERGSEGRPYSEGRDASSSTGNAYARSDAVSPDRFGDGRPVRTRLGTTTLFDELNWDYAVIERLNRDTLSTQVLPFNLGKAILQNDPTQNLELQPGDVVTIFSQRDLRVPIARQTRLVSIEGEIGSPGVYQLRAGETLKQVLARAGGFTNEAYVYGLDFSREETRQKQRENLQQAVIRLESLAATQAARDAANRREDQATSSVSNAATQAQLARLRRIEPNGRIALELQPDVVTLDSLPDVPLEHGDRIVVPARPGFVTVAGAVVNSNAFLWKTGRSAGDYLKLAGLDEAADPSNMFILRADGTVSHAGDRRGIFGIGGGLAGQAMFPGDALIVPNQLDYETWGRAFIRNLKDFSQIFSQFGLGAAAIVTLRNNSN